MKLSDSSEFSRPWKEGASRTADSSDDSSASDESSRFRLTSYNILSQYYAQRTPHLYRHLDGANLKFLEWETRWPKICAEIETLDSDILCLQEVEMEQYDTTVHAFLRARNYKCKFFKKFNLNDGQGIIL